jgi:hypothetical protein
MPRAAWQGTPLTVVVLLEEDNASLAEWIGVHILQAALESN